MEGRAREPTRPYGSDRGGVAKTRGAACSALQSPFCHAAAPSDADSADALGYAARVSWRDTALIAISSAASDAKILCPLLCPTRGSFHSLR